MRSIKICLGLVLLLWAPTGCASTGAVAPPGEVASEIKEIVAHKDVIAFQNLFNNTDLFSVGDVKYYFGEGDESNLVEFMSRPKVRYRLFFHGSNKVTILYFDEDLSSSPDVLDWGAVGQSWLSSYAAVDLIKTDRGWLFEQTPFFFFRHVPWADDY